MHAVDDAMYLPNSHLIIVKSPISGICIVEPTDYSFYQILKVFPFSS